MNTQTSPQTKFLEVVDNFIVYAIGSNVYQIEVTAHDLEEVLGVEARKWECNYSGKFYSDTQPVYASLAEVSQLDYPLLITALMAKAEDVTDSYESPVTMIDKYKAQITQLTQIEEKETLLREQLKDLEELRKQIVCQEICKSSLIANALDKMGVANYYFVEERRGFSPPDEVKRKVKIDGATVVVTLNLESGFLLFDGLPVSNKTLSFTE